MTVSTDSPRVAIVLVNYQHYAAEYLDACYQSVVAQTYPPEQTTLFIVDNQTSPQTQALIRRTAPRARLIPSHKNLGWAGGNNLAIETALQENADFLVLLNLDTVVDPHWLTALIDAAQQRPECQILQSKILLYGNHHIHSVGNRIHYLGYGYCLGYGQPEELTTIEDSVDFASGAAMLIKREVFERIGLLREDYFMYYEDLEFCWRARLAGYSVGLAEGSICYHKYSFANAMNLLYYLQRNRLLTLFTLERFGTLLVVLPCLAVAEVIVGLYFLSRGKGLTVLRSWAYFLQPSTWAAIRQRRRALHHLRRRSDTDVVSHFAGRIVFAEVDSPLFRWCVNPLLAAYWAVARRLILW